MKVYISFAITDNPHGGGNQFLKCLKKQFLKTGHLTLDPSTADIILYNGHHEIQNTASLKSKYPSKKFIHRIDGLQKLYNNQNDTRQDLAISYNKLSHATVFQSHWAKNEFYKADFDPAKSTVIHNFADSKIFNRSHERPQNKKIELLCTSWSPNPKKGFVFYKKLDAILDFNRFNFTFVGNRPENIIYKNIKCLAPETTINIAKRMKETDVFVSATEDDCCSNSIIEALSSGVPTLALNSGGNPELVKEGGLLFENLEDFVQKLSLITSNIEHYKKHICVKTAKETAEQYLNFFYEISEH